MKNEVAVAKTPEQQINEITSRIKVFERDGELWTDSLSVAEVFGKEHKDILKVIRKADQENQLVNLRSFAPVEYIDKKGEARPAFEMTETGFFALVARFNDQKDTDIALIRSCYFKKFDQYKKFRHVEIDTRPVRQIDLNELMASINDSHRALIRMLERHDHSLCTIEQKSDKTERRVDEIAVKQEQMAGTQEQMADDLSYVKDKMEGILKRNDLTKPVIQQHEKMIMERFLGNCPCCGDIQIIGKNGKMITGVAEKEHFFGPTQNKLGQTWITCKQCNRDKRDGKLSMDFIKKKFDSYQADLMMDIQKKKRNREEYEKKMPKQFGLFDFMKDGDAATR
jgi:Rha family phage regulatory protein